MYITRGAYLTHICTVFSVHGIRIIFNLLRNLSQMYTFFILIGCKCQESLREGFDLWSMNKNPTEIPLARLTDDDDGMSGLSEGRPISASNPDMNDAEIVLKLFYSISKFKENVQMQFSIQYRGYKFKCFFFSCKFSCNVIFDETRLDDGRFLK